ncbi:hypothetical protein [Thermodesulfovibrio hydrogeniphilus]
MIEIEKRAFEFNVNDNPKIFPENWLKESKFYNGEIDPPEIYKFFKWISGMLIVSVIVLYSVFTKDGLKMPVILTGVAFLLILGGLILRFRWDWFPILNCKFLIKIKELFKSKSYSTKLKELMPNKLLLLANKRDNSRDNNKEQQEHQQEQD